jgi:hypothetical protein
MMNKIIQTLWSRTEIALWPEEYVLVSLPHESLIEALSMVSSAAGHFSAIVVEKDEVSLTVEKDLWEARAAVVAHHSADGPFRAITLQVNVELGVSGYFAPAAERLADAGISIVPQCAFLKDHVLIRASDADRAVEIMENLIKECQETHE